MNTKADMQKIYALACCLALLMLSPAMHGAVINQTVTSGGESTAWNAAIWGTPAAAPVPGNDYQVATGTVSSSNTKLGGGTSLVSGRVRAYSSSPSFSGGSLKILPKTELLLKGKLPATYNGNFILSGGVIRLSPNTGGAATLTGTIEVVRNSYIGVVQRKSGKLTIDSTLVGSKVIHLLAGEGDRNRIAFGGNLSKFSGMFDVGGGRRILTVDFRQNYQLPSVALQMHGRDPAERLDLTHHLTFHTFSFGGNGLAPGTYLASQLNALFGTGDQFLNNKGSLTVLAGPTNTTPAVATKVFIIGDSTVLNFWPIVGWGQAIFRYFKPDVRFVDEAYPGKSSKTFITDGRWAKVLGQLSTNDYLLIQFGHNDSHNPTHHEATDANGDYKTYLQQYIDQARAKGAIPVLVTPMHRRSFNKQGKLLSYIVDSTGYTNDLAPYAAAMKQVAQANNVPCVDLFARSGKYMQRLGYDRCAKLMHRGNLGHTHFNELGATAMAALVAEGLRGVLAAPNDHVKKWELIQYLRTNVLDVSYHEILAGKYPGPVFTQNFEASKL